MLKYLEDLHKLLYHLGNSSLKHTLDSLTRAIKEGHDAKAKDTYTKYLTEYYRVIQTETQLPFSPPVVAGYQVEADRLHDRLENDPDKKPLEEAFGRLYAEIFRLNLFQIQEAVHWRTIATVYHDLAEKEGTAKNEAEKCWKKAEEYLEKFYRALGEFIA